MSILTRKPEPGDLYSPADVHRGMNASGLDYETVAKIVEAVAPSIAGRERNTCGLM